MVSKVLQLNTIKMRGESITNLIGIYSKYNVILYYKQVREPRPSFKIIVAVTIYGFVHKIPFSY